MSVDEIELVEIDGESYFKIGNVERLRPFFMSIVSDSNHWMFISSSGGLTAGRRNADFSLFPYYTDDKISESIEHTGAKSIFRVEIDGKQHIWEPFSYRQEGLIDCTRNLYKNRYGDKIIFEEVNNELELSFRYQWSSSDRFGFVKTSKIENLSGFKRQLSFVDGIQNVLPYGAGSNIQNASSNLVDAYKRTELEPDSQLGIFALSAIIVDRAEPSEALKANIAWNLGLDHPTILLSSLQLNQFRKGQQVTQETDIKAERGAYFVTDTLELNAGDSKEWMIVADVNKNHSAVIKAIQTIKNEQDLKSQIIADVKLGTEKLIALVASSDGVQYSADYFRDTRHFSNTLFNIMRGGIFPDQYEVNKSDFAKYIRTANKELSSKIESRLAAMPDRFNLSGLDQLNAELNDADFQRLSKEYLPLNFSRRHGDPSRPWNKFDINTQNELDGSTVLDYEGNWRDIFQNWEALGLSYPYFLEGMIHKFLNATTFEGYNPYRVVKDGFDWETIEPDNPWSYIGYWGDHQIIYLQKLLELSNQFNPDSLKQYFDKEIFAYANVPYKIKDFQAIYDDPKDTIIFDEELDIKVRKLRDEMGSDGALLFDNQSNLHRVNFVEKILATLLSKVSNLIPEGGIWMNTQRPEWNDANNALVGNGLSMVTVYYMRRFLKFVKSLFAQADMEMVNISKEMYQFYSNISDAINIFSGELENGVSNESRYQLVKAMGVAGSNFRKEIYENGFSGNRSQIDFNAILQFVDNALKVIDHSIKGNQRSDKLYHAYNLIDEKDGGKLSVSYLSEMLEGQVAVLSSDFLSSKAALEVLDALKSSKLFRAEQYSYILYPNKELPKFLEKNTIPSSHIDSNPLLMQLIADENILIVEKDIIGAYHFNGNLKNSYDLEEAMNNLDSDRYGLLVESNKAAVLDTFELVFNHKEFTGRSGTFYGYEGLGSIYWHMVSKLQLAVLECCYKAIRDEESAEIIGRLLEHYYEINAGIGVHKSPKLYGAFPTDPYSHTPWSKGAQQPGMTGQVKEDILSRFGELGVFSYDGQIKFFPALLRKVEFYTNNREVEFFDVNNERQGMSLKTGSLAFSYCQTPVVYKLSDTNRIEVYYKDSSVKSFEGLTLDQETSSSIFSRENKIARLDVYLDQTQLK